MASMNKRFLYLKFLYLNYTRIHVHGLLKLQNTGTNTHLSSSMTRISRENVFLATFFFFSLAWWNLWKRYSSLSMSWCGVMNVRYVVRKASWYINSTENAWHHINWQNEQVSYLQYKTNSKPPLTAECYLEILRLTFFEGWNEIMDHKNILKISKNIQAMHPFMTYYILIFLYT